MAALKKVVIIAPGSFNPPTYGHLRMLEDAKESLEASGYKVLEGIMTAVSDGYGKPTLVSSHHRLLMTLLAAGTSSWIRADSWECTKPQWTPTVGVLKYYEKSVKRSFGKDVGVMLLVGGDVVDTFDKFNPDGTPVWKAEDVAEIVKFGLIVQPRPESNPEQTLAAMNLINGNSNVHVIKNTVAASAISSTKVRQAIKDKSSIKYLTTDSIITYIDSLKLYI